MLLNSVYTNLLHL